MLSVTLALGVACALGLIFGPTRRPGSPLAALLVLCGALALARSVPFPLLPTFAMGAFWQFHALGNGGFYMAPDVDHDFEVACDNGFEDTMSADALGVTTCLYAYSALSFGEGAFAEVCGEQYHQLREYALDHPEAAAILAAID